MKTNETEPRKIKSVYACACWDRRNDELVFITFNTRNENDARKLAMCIDSEIGPKSLVIINEHGDIHLLD